MQNGSVCLLFLIAEIYYSGMVKVLFDKELHTYVQYKWLSVVLKDSEIHCDCVANICFYFTLY